MQGSNNPSRISRHKTNEVTNAFIVKEEVNAYGVSVP